MKLAALGPTKTTILALAIITGIIHLLLGGPLFILNGLGFLALAGAYVLQPAFLKPVKPFLGMAFIAFAAVTIILYFAFNWPDVWGPLGIFTKLVELALVVQLLRDR